MNEDRAVLSLKSTRLIGCKSWDFRFVDAIAFIQVSKFTVDKVYSEKDVGGGGGGVDGR